jgi:tRNA-specific 2-thiouridylase
MPAGKEKVLVAMSGGVDSSVAAWLLLRAGYEVTGVFLCLGGTVEAGHETRGCCSPTDAADARRVADKLGIDLFVLDAGREFAGIIEYFVGEYARGRTPNPCIHCNRLVKFARLLARADDLGAAYVATGHYARLVRDDRAGCAIHRGRTKDQSYALFGLARENLGRVLLPVGDIPEKAQVRRIAADLRLPVADKPDSQDICFVSGSYVDLLRRRRPEAFRPGDIVDSSGRVLGRHDGVGRFTVGQRHGLKVARGVPMYVTRIDSASGTVVIGPGEEVLSGGLTARSANWQGDVPACGGEFEATVQIRYNHAGAPARVKITGEDSFTVEFAQPVAAVTPGQAAVVYDGQRLLGGGWIQ